MPGAAAKAGRALLFGMSLVLGLGLVALVVAFAYLVYLGFSPGH
jgi:hypothetical protein